MIIPLPFLVFMHVFAHKIRSFFTQTYKNVFIMLLLAGPVLLFFRGRKKARESKDHKFYLVTRTTTAADHSAV